MRKSETHLVPDILKIHKLCQKFGLKRSENLSNRKKICQTESNLTKTKKTSQRKVTAISTLCL